MVLLLSKGSCGTESQTLTVNVFSKVRFYHRAPSKGMGGKSDPLQLGLELGVFLKEKNKEAAINHQLCHFLIMTLGVRMSLAYDSLARLAMAGGP